MKTAPKHSAAQDSRVETVEGHGDECEPPPFDLSTNRSGTDNAPNVHAPNEYATDDRIAKLEALLDEARHELQQTRHTLELVDAERASLVRDSRLQADDVRALAECARVGGMIVDENFCVRSISGPIGQVIVVTSADIGRRLDHFPHRLTHPNFYGELRNLLLGGNDIDSILSNDAGEVFRVCVRPFERADQSQGLAITATPVPATNAPLAAPSEELILDVRRGINSIHNAATVLISSSHDAEISESAVHTVQKEAHWISCVLDRHSENSQGNRLTVDEFKPIAVDGVETVVVIEDNADTRFLLETVLEMEGYRVRSAADGATGLQLLLEIKPRVALVDIGLPELDGYSVARKVREQHNSDTIHLIATTGYGRKSDRQRVFAAGFDQHLIKPVDMNVVRDTLKRCLQH